MSRSLRSRGRGCILLLLVAALGVGCGGEAGQAAKQGEGGRGGKQAFGGRGRPGGMPGGAAIPVEAKPVDRGDIAASLLTYTTIEAERHVDVVARTQGLVETIYVEEGDRVKEGQPLAQLDDDALKLQVEEKGVNLQSLKATLDRAEELRKKELISKEEFDQSRYNYETAKTQYESAKLNLEYATIRSPFSGIVSERLIEVGNLVNANQAVFRVADLNPLLARIFVPEKNIRKVTLGQAARVTVEGTEKKYIGRVQMISPIVDPESGTVKVTVEITDRSHTLRPGMFTTVHIITDVHKNALRIAKKALVTEAEGTYAFLFKGGAAQKTRLQLGVSEGNWVEVTDGLADGDSVIMVGQEGLRNGAQVRIAGAPVASPPLAAGEGQGEGRVPGAQGFQRGGQGRAGGGQGARVRRGAPGGMMNLDQIKERMLKNPRVKEAYDKRVKEDPDFVKNEEKQRRFFRTMFRQMRGGERGFRGQ